ncbi:uncharacterized protein LOC122085798 [Macadamia integrifolia]|uniref:uncharacterized protein LOC122085798 n=1 Tax=Macadamia integrifolia TaxID=60698 RepID=UPI001C4F4678|nr:uncharacterized protein LOC122085798 [Macadamia integrifolia]
MATAALRSQDCLRGRFPAETLTSPPFKPRRTSNSNANPSPNPNPNPTFTRSGRRKRTQVGSPDKENRRSRCEMAGSRLPAKNMIMGQVTILKRGEMLKPTEDRVRGVVEEEAKTNEVPVLYSTERLGPEPDMVPKQIGLTDVKSVDGVFAGSAFLTSPPPSSLPLPGFFTNKVVPSKNDVATTDLRRLLRLDL